MLKHYSSLTKFGIVVFVVLAGIAGYATSYQVEKAFDWIHFLGLVMGLYFLSSGSLALNQAQEYKLDQLMPRTAKRPVAAKKVSPFLAYGLSAVFILLGLALLYHVSLLSALLGVATVVLYNVVYTMWWKPKWVFAAIPGALPGALPVSIGFVANDPNLLARDSIYLFLILYLWQMPHFWALAMKFKEDYRSAGVPTLPVKLGEQKTLFHMGIWTYLYLIVALASPWFVHGSWAYLALVVPVVLFTLIEFHRYQKSLGKKRWFAFFMWVNFSVLVFMFVPVIDRWNFLFTSTN